MAATVDLSKDYRGRNQIYKFATLIMKGNVVTPDTTEVYEERRNEAGDLAAAFGETVPTLNEAGFAKGCEFTDTNLTDGEWPVYVNVGDELACNFVSTGVANAEQELDFNNDTGGTLTKGTLVFVSGWDTTAGKFTVTKADKNTDLATYVVQADVLTTADGVLVKKGTLTGLNTAGRTIDDDVWLGDTGAFTFTEPSGSDDMSQVVGQVKVVDASVGEIYFDISAGADVIGTNQLRNQAVTVDKLHNDARMNSVVVELGQMVAPTGSDQLNVDRRAWKAPSNSEIVSAYLLSDTATSGSAPTDRYEFEVYNFTAAQSLSTTPKITDAGELAVDTPYALTVDQNAQINSGAEIGLRTDIKDTGAGGPTDLSLAKVRMQINYRVRQ